MSQTAVANKMTVGLVGQIATMHGMADAQVDTAHNEEAATAIVPGRFVKIGAADKVDGALIPAAQNDVLKGIATFMHEYERSVELDGNGAYLPGTSFGCLTKGPVTVAPTEAVAPGDDVRVQMVAEANHPAGAIRKTASAGKTIDISALARWKTSGGAGDPVVLEIDMTNIALAALDA